jgi:hypothetical protein
MLMLVPIGFCTATHKRDMAREIIFLALFPEMFTVLKTVPKKVQNINMTRILHPVQFIVEGRVKVFNYFAVFCDMRLSRLLNCSCRPSDISSH